MVDVTNPSSFDAIGALNFFRTSSRNLIAAEQAAHVRHHVVLSVVGADRLLGSGYFRAKLLQENLVRASRIPHTILRSTQFFEFLSRIAQPDAEGRAVHVSTAWTQPIASDEVAAALADIATLSPRNGIMEFGGPDLFHIDEVVRRVMRANHDSREVVGDPQAPYFGAALEQNALIPDESAIIGVGQFDDWLKDTFQHHPPCCPQLIGFESSLERDECNS